MPEITVGMSSYNRKDLLREALQSVVTQQNADFEVIVVDDGSTDGSAEMVEQEFPQVRVIRKTNGGDASAKNMAAANAQGKYLVFLDSDDIMLPGALEMLMRPCGRMTEPAHTASIHALMQTEHQYRAS